MVIGAHSCSIKFWWREHFLCSTVVVIAFIFAIFKVILQDDNKKIFEMA